MFCWGFFVWTHGEDQFVSNLWLVTEQSWLPGYNRSNLSGDKNQILRFIYSCCSHWSLPDGLWGPGVFHMGICVMCIRFCIPFFKVFKHHWHYHKPSLEETFHHTSAAVMFTIKCYLHDGKGRLGWNQAEKVLTLLFTHPHSTSNFNTLLLSWCNYKSYWTNYGIC